MRLHGLLFSLYFYWTGSVTLRIQPEDDMWLCDCLYGKLVHSMHHL